MLPSYVAVWGDASAFAPSLLRRVDGVAVQIALGPTGKTKIAGDTGLAFVAVWTATNGMTKRHPFQNQKRVSPEY